MVLTLLLWPCNVGILVRFTSFLTVLPWPSGVVDLGHFCISFWEPLILLVIDCLEKRLQGPMSGPIVNFDSLCACVRERELKFGMVVNFCLGVFVGSCLVILVLI